MATVNDYQDALGAMQIVDEQLKTRDSLLSFSPPPDALEAPSNCFLWALEASWDVPEVNARRATGLGFDFQPHEAMLMKYDLDSRDQPDAPGFEKITLRRCPPAYDPLTHRVRVTFFAHVFRNPR